MKLPPRTKTIILTALFAAICAGAFTHGVEKTVQFPHWVVDDAFILYRYAENLAEHGELNWNPGEDPVEGYTGIALVTLLSVTTKLGISPIAASHAIGIAFFFIGGILILLILRGFNIGSATALILYFTTPFMFSHVWSGLETTIFITAILFAVYTYTLHRDKLFIFSLLLLSFTRPEGVLLSVLLLALYRPHSRVTIAAYLVPCIVYFLWRWIYYGQLLPNTFYAKASSVVPIGENIKSLKQLFRNYMRLPLLLGLIFFSYGHFRKRKNLVGAVLAFVLLSLYLYVTSDLIMNYSYRFFVPFYVLTLLAVGGIMLGPRMNLKMIVIAVIIVSTQVSFNIDRKRSTKIKEHASSHYKLLKDCHIALGRYLQAHLPPDEWLVVHADAGAIPYYSKMKTRDFGRLNDEYLARNFPIKWESVRGGSKAKSRAEGETGKQDTTEIEMDDPALIGDLVDYFYSGLPGALVFTSYNFRAIRHGSEPIWFASDERFNNYTLVKKYKSSARNNYYEFLYIRNDLLDRVEVDHTGDRQRAETILARKNNDRQRAETISGSKNIESKMGQKRDASTSELRQRGTKPKASAGTLARIEGASVSPDSLWALASEKITPWAKIECYRKLVGKYSDHKHAPSASFMIGFVYAEELLDTLAAREAFEQTIKLYPDSEISGSARWMLEQLGGGEVEKRDAEK